VTIADRPVKTLVDTIRNFSRDLHDLRSGSKSDKK